MSSADYTVSQDVDPIICDAILHDVCIGLHPRVSYVNLGNFSLLRNYEQSVFDAQPGD